MAWSTAGPKRIADGPWSWRFPGGARGRSPMDARCRRTMAMCGASIARALRRSGVNREVLDPCAGWTWNRHGHYDSHIPEVFPYVTFSGRRWGRGYRRPPLLLRLRCEDRRQQIRRRAIPGQVRILFAALVVDAERLIELSVLHQEFDGLGVGGRSVMASRSTVECTAAYSPRSASRMVRKPAFCAGPP